MLRHFLLSITILSTACVASIDDAQPLPTASRRPLARPSSVVPGERRWFVLRSVDLGMKTPDSWSQLGFDLDRRSTSAEESKTSANSCRRANDSSSRALADGADGIDNSFGHWAMSIVKSFKADANEVANAEIASGGYTLLLRIDGAVDGDNASAPGALYAAGKHAGKPTFAPDDQWPVWSSTLSDGVDLEKPIRKFPLGYVRSGTWVSGEVGEGPEPIWFPLFGPMKVQASALLSVELATGKGVMAGALPVPELLSMTSRWLQKAGSCPGDDAHRIFFSTMAQSADLVLGGKDLQDPGRSCDAVSFGIGFELTKVKAPTVVVAEPEPEPSECADKL